MTKQKEPKQDAIAKGANAGIRAMRARKGMRLTIEDKGISQSNKFMGDFIRMNTKRGLELSPEEAKAYAAAEAEFDADVGDDDSRRPIDVGAGAGTGTAPPPRRDLNINDRMRALVVYRRRMNLDVK